MASARDQHIAVASAKVNKTVDEVAGYFDYLDELKSLGKTTMFSGINHLMEKYKVTREVAGKIVIEWLKAPAKNEYLVVPLENGDVFLIENGTQTHRGTGNFCGYYTKEYYKDFRLVASLDDDLKTPIRNDKECYGEEVQICSTYKNTTITAKDDNDAYEQFVEYVNQQRKRMEK